MKKSVRLRRRSVTVFDEIDSAGRFLRRRRRRDSAARHDDSPIESRNSCGLFIQPAHTAPRVRSEIGYVSGDAWSWKTPDSFSESWKGKKPGRPRQRLVYKCEIVFRRIFHTVTTRRCVFSSSNVPYSRAFVIRAQTRRYYYYSPGSSHAPFET